MTPGWKGLEVWLYNRIQWDKLIRVSSKLAIVVIASIVVLTLY